MGHNCREESSGISLVRHSPPGFMPRSSAPPCQVRLEFLPGIFILVRQFERKSKDWSLLLEVANYSLKLSFGVGIFVVLPPAATSMPGLLLLLGLLLAFLTLFTSESSWMDLRLKTCVLLCRYCRVAAAGNLYFTGHGNGSCVGLFHG